MFLIYRYSLTDCYVTNILLPLCFKKIWISRLNICSVERDLNVPVLQVKKGEGQQQHQSSFSLYINPKTYFYCTEEEKFETVPPDSDHKLQIQEGDLHNPDGDHEEALLEESCLKQLYPDPYQEECDQFHILGRVAKLYMNSLGVRKSAGMSSSSFRTFIRLASLDIENQMSCRIKLFIMLWWTLTLNHIYLISKLKLKDSNTCHTYT